MTKTDTTEPATTSIEDRIVTVIERHLDATNTHRDEAVKAAEALTDDSDEAEQLDVMRAVQAANDRAAGTHQRALAAQSMLAKVRRIADEAERL